MHWHLVTKLWASVNQVEIISFWFWVMSYNYNVGAGAGPGTGHHNNTFGDHDFAYDDKSFYCYPHYQQTHTAALRNSIGNTLGFTNWLHIWSLTRVIILKPSLCWLDVWLSPPAWCLARPRRCWPLIIITQSIQGSLTSRHSNKNILKIRATLSSLLKGSLVKIYQTQFRKQSPD